MRVAASLVGLTVLLSVPVQAEEPDGQWQLTFDITGLGVLETVVDFDAGECLTGHSISAAPTRHRSFTGSQISTARAELQSLNF